MNGKVWSGFVVLLFYGQAWCQDDCNLKKDSDGIKVYTCTVPDEKFKFLRAEFSIPSATIDQLKAILLDGDNYLTWQYQMTESKVLERVSENEIIVRSVLNAPWPVSDREMIARMKILEATTDRMRVEVQAIAYVYESDEGLVRVRYSLAEWNIEKINNDLSIHYSLKINPGGSVPAWLVNMAMAEGPYTTFKNLKAKLAAAKK